MFDVQTALSTNYLFAYTYKLFYTIPLPCNNGSDLPMTKKINPDALLLFYFSPLEFTADSHKCGQLLDGLHSLSVASKHGTK